MWLLNARTKVLESFEGNDIPSYAILSHRWEEDEILFGDIGTDGVEQKKGWRKIEFCCNQAIDECDKLINSSSSTEESKQESAVYVWIDTCCINKTNSTELSEAINSMYKWYQAARVCYAYLCDVDDEDGLEESVWFTRCWTLQELIAPGEVQFYSRDWEKLGTKSELCQALARRTGIPEYALQNFRAEAYSVAERMSWTADRCSSRIEDAAYSLLGIFGVNMPMIYGEGSRAFQRLQEEIIRRSEDLTIFAWSKVVTTRISSNSGMLALSPDFYEKQGLRFAPFILRRELGFLALEAHSRPHNQWQGTSMVSAGVTLDLYLVPFLPTYYLAAIARESQSPELNRKRKATETGTTAVSSIARGDEPCSDLIFMILNRKHNDWCFQRVSIDGSHIFRAPTRWLAGGRVRNVILENNQLAQLPSAMKSAHARFGFWIHKVASLSVTSSPETIDQNCVQLLSRAERSSKNYPGTLLLRPGQCGVAGMVRLNMPSKMTVLVFGFTFDFDVFCIAIRPDLPCDEVSDIDELYLTVPRLRRKRFSIASNLDMTKLVDMMSSRTEDDFDLDTDSLAYYLLDWAMSDGVFHILRFGRITFQRDHARQLFFRVHISLGNHRQYLQSPENTELRDTWHIEPWVDNTT